MGLVRNLVYPANPAIVHWRGGTLDDGAAFDLFLHGPVRARVTDEVFNAKLAQDLQALATTHMASDTLKTVLATDPDPVDWEIGEAMAECLLEEEFGVVWPWNENRDKKTPRASLPGADLVGFVDDGGESIFLFGEVKTSFDKTSPPGVMNGRGGLSHQIDSLATSNDIHLSLLRWLAARCTDPALQAQFQSASRRYLQSKGKDIALVGVLLRDTPPHEDDLRTRGTKLAKIGATMPKIRLDAWYTPRPISDWVRITMSGP